MRLFVAFNIPSLLRREAINHQPQQGEKIRLTQAMNLHVTLHFIGHGDSALVHSALQQVSAKAFDTSLSNTGFFPLAAGKKILWLAVDSSKELLALHHAVGRSLQGIGITPSKHDYQPHLTLARCKSGYSQAKIEAFLNSGFAPKKFKVNQFALFNSETIEGVLIYTRLHVYDLL